MNKKYTGERTGCATAERAEYVNEGTEVFETSRAERLRQSVNNVSSLIVHLTAFKSQIGLPCDPVSDLGNMKEPDCNLLDALYTSPAKLDEMVDYAHQLIDELESALR
jgi:hypothetical protein